ncbi:hypothetical protein L6452_04560 [Arctium lappa]|uniref:Uncharacterized protein n=1 Tax=Arctium lappa TaxID=4217 RepID=A0ACB9EDY5_ARCLA|nr:hypothetical protein L6452_04560 [Arctium lappa]
MSYKTNPLKYEFRKCMIVVSNNNRAELRHWKAKEEILRDEKKAATRSFSSLPFESFTIAVADFRWKLEAIL